MTARSAWVWYLTGALLTLLWKLIRYVRAEKKKGVAAHDAVMEWFFEDSTENASSWCTTISLVWVGGAIYITLRENGGIFSFVQVVPLHNAIAFALGGIMELAAPAIVRNFVSWVISKMPGGTGQP